MEEDEVPLCSLHAVVLFDLSIHQAESECVWTTAIPRLQGRGGASC